MKTLSKDILLTLLIKCLLLGLLWYCFFSKPVGRHIHTPELAERLLGNATPIKTLNTHYSLVRTNP